METAFKFGRIIITLYQNNHVVKEKNRRKKFTKPLCITYNYRREPFVKTGENWD